MKVTQVIEPWFPMFSDWIYKTAHLTDTQKAVLMDMIVLHWGIGPLPDDMKLIERMRRSASEEWKIVRQIYFVLKDGHWMIPDLMEHQRKTRDLSRLRRQNASKQGKIKRPQPQVNRTCDASATQVNRKCDADTTQVNHKYDASATQVNRKCVSHGYASALSESISESESDSESDSSPTPIHTPTPDIERLETIKNIGKNGNGVGRRFLVPRLEEVALHMERMSAPRSEAQAFIDYYESNGWKVGRNPMKNWKGAASGWARRWKERRNERAGLNVDGEDLAKQIADDRHRAQIMRELSRI